jgi:hypothetical protein
LEGQRLAWAGQSIPSARIVVVGRVVELGSLGGSVVAAAGIDRMGRVGFVGGAGRVVDRGMFVVEGIVLVADTKVESGMLVGIVVARLGMVADLGKIQEFLPSPLPAWAHSQPEEEDKLDTYSAHPVP